MLEGMNLLTPETQDKLGALFSEEVEAQGGR
jgi:hypothetical protein